MSEAATDYELVAPETLPEVLSLLTMDWRPIAGGTDIMVLLSAGQLRVKKLVSLQHLHELQTIEVTETHVSIGSGVTYTAIRNHPVLQREFELLCLAASWTGGIANQNRGTVGGNIANASPAADGLPMLLLYDAELELTSFRGTRRVPYESFHTGYKTMLMEPDELLTRILLPRPSTQPIAYARKVGTRRAMAISKVSMGALAWIRGTDIFDVRIALGSVAPIPLRCRKTESVLIGSTLSHETRARAIETLSTEITPIDDIRSTIAYRRRVTLNLLSEFLDLVQAKSTLDRWNKASYDEAVQVVLKCCGSSLWAEQLTRLRPFAALDELLKSADSLWRNLDESDWLEAFRAHPKIGGTPSKPWESQEQSGMQRAAEDLRDLLAGANDDYEAKFGFIFIICATDKTADEMFSNLQQRLCNSRETELREASEQQNQITRLRLRKWLNA